jgi:hypothetical protein
MFRNSTPRTVSIAVYGYLILYPLKTLKSRVSLHRLERCDFRPFAANMVGCGFCMHAVLAVRDPSFTDFDSKPDCRQSRQTDRSDRSDHSDVCLSLRLKISHWSEEAKKNYIIKPDLHHQTRFSFFSFPYTPS